MSGLRLIFSHALFISCCSAGITAQTYWLIQRPVQTDVCLLIALSTFLSYNLYRLVGLYPFNQWQQLRPFIREQRFSFMLLPLASAWIIWLLSGNRALIPGMIAGFFMTALYFLPLFPITGFNYWKKAGFMKTVLLALTWTYVTVHLPLQSINNLEVEQIWALYTWRFSFIFILCIMFDSRDEELDQLRFLGSLVTSVSPRILRLITLVSFILLFFAAYAFCGGAAQTRQLMALWLTGVMTILVYRLSLGRRGYYFYYFGVDGIMLFSTLASYVASI